MMGMGMDMEGGGDYSGLYAQAKEILAAGMLAELKEDAEEAMGGEGGYEEESCPHCGSKMGSPMGNPMATPRLAQPMGLPPELAMRVPASYQSPMPMGGASLPQMNLGV